MSAEEFVKWKLIYYKLDPFGERRADLRAGTVIAPLLNLLKSRWIKNPQPSNPSQWVLDFVTRWKPKVQSAGDMKAIAKALAGVK